MREEVCRQSFKFHAAIKIDAFSHRLISSLFAFVGKGSVERADTTRRARRRRAGSEHYRVAT